MTKMLSTRFVSIICVIVMLSVLFSTSALAEYATWHLEGKWYCYYSYDYITDSYSTDTERYTFWGISGDRGNYRYENITTGESYSGTFFLVNYSDHTFISFLIGNGAEEYVYYFDWAPEAGGFSLSADNLYLAHFMDEKSYNQMIEDAKAFQ